MVALGSLTIEEPCYGTSSTAISRTSEKQPKYIRITDFDDYGIEEKHEFMTVNSYSEKHLLKPNDILFARTGGTVGKTYFYNGTIGEAVFAGYCIRFRFDEDKVNPQYVYWYTKTDVYQKWVRGIQRPSGQPNINKEEYKAFRIALPEKKVQDNLCNFMDNTFKKRNEKLKQAEELLGKMSVYILSMLNLRLSDFKQRLCVSVRLREVLNDRTFSAEYHHPERMMAIHALRTQKNMKMMKLVDIVDFCREIINSADSQAKYLGLAGVESQTGELSGANEEATGQAFIYQIGDVLYGRLRPYLNKVLLAEESGICSTEFHVMRVKDTSVILPEYLSAIMRSDLIVAQTKHMMTGNTHPRISNDDVKNLYIPVPEVSIQQAIISELGHRRDKARTLKREAEQDWEAAKVQFEKKLLGY